MENFRSQSESPEQTNQTWIDQYQYLVDEIINENYLNGSAEEEEDLRQAGLLAIMEVGRDLASPKSDDFQKAILKKMSEMQNPDTILISELPAADSVARGDFTNEILLKVNYLAALPPQYQAVVENYFGLNEKPRLSVDEICQKYNIRPPKVGKIINYFRERAQLTESRGEEM